MKTFQEWLAINHPNFTEDRDPNEPGSDSYFAKKDQEHIEATMKNRKTRHRVPTDSRRRGIVPKDIENDQE
jgi:hypothetical protein